MLATVSNYEELMKIADNAMYEVKESGKNGYKIINKLTEP